MRLTDERLNDVLQHLQANHEQELCRVHTITYTRTTYPKKKTQSSKKKMGGGGGGSLLRVKILGLVIENYFLIFNRLQLIISLHFSM